MQARRCSRRGQSRQSSGAEPPWRGCEPQTHAAGVLGLVPVPLTLFAQGAGTTVRDPGLINQTQAAVSLWSPFTTPQALASRAAQAPIRLEGKVQAREAARFPRRVALAGSL
jgi:hypothetical protein